MSTIVVSAERFAEVFMKNEHARLDDLDAAVLEGAEDGVEILKHAAPKDLGSLQESIVLHPGTGSRGASGEKLIATVVADAPFAAFQERGTRPHMPPVAPLEAWAQRHGMVGAGYAIAKKIEARGNIPQWYAKTSLSKMGEAVAVRLAALGSR
jgi:hypothetical protein